MRTDSRALRAFPMEVRRAVIAVVKREDLRWRVQYRSGGHLYLYPKDGTRPFKLSASRPAERSLQYLGNWCEHKGYYVPLDAFGRNGNGA